MFAYLWTTRERESIRTMARGMSRSQRLATMRGLLAHRDDNGRADRKSLAVARIIAETL